MSNHRKDNPNRRDARLPKVSPQKCDGVPISMFGAGRANINKLLKGARQERLRARGYRLSHKKPKPEDFAFFTGLRV